MRDDYTLRVLIERLERQGATEKAIVRAVREAAQDDRGREAGRPLRRQPRLLRRRG